MEDRFVIRQSKKGNIMYMMSSLGFTVTCLLLVMIDYREALQLKSILIYGFSKLIMVIGVIFFGYAFLYLLKRDITNNELLVIDKKGITDYTSAIANGFVPWEDIQEILLRSMLGNVFIELVIKDEQRYLNNMTLMQRLCAQANKKMGHEIICMTLNTTGKNPHEVFKIAQVYFKEYLKTQE